MIQRLLLLFARLHTSGPVLHARAADVATTGDGSFGDKIQEWDHVLADGRAKSRGG